MKIIITFFLFLTSFTTFADDSVKILSMSPLNISPLYAGQKVNIEVEIEYNLESTDTGVITLVIQQAESDKSSLANESDFVYKGNGIIKLNKELTIPATRGLVIFTPLSPEGMTTTTIVDSKMYKVLNH